MTRRKRLSALERSRLRQASARRRGPDPADMIRYAGLGVAVLLFLAVGAGFRGDMFGSRLRGVFAALGPAAEPLLLGLSLLEWIAVALGLGLAGLMLAAGLRRKD